MWTHVCVRIRVCEVYVYVLCAHTCVWGVRVYVCAHLCAHLCLFGACMYVRVFVWCVCVYNYPYFSLVGPRSPRPIPDTETKERETLNRSGCFVKLTLLLTPVFHGYPCRSLSDRVHRSPRVRIVPPPHVPRF